MINYKPKSTATKSVGKDATIDFKIENDDKKPGTGDVAQ